jgi:hypothetical protein
VIKIAPGIFENAISNVFRLSVYVERPLAG